MPEVVNGGAAGAAGASGAGASGASSDVNNNASSEQLGALSYVFLNSKGGMDGVDMQSVQQVVAAMSAGSRHEANERRKATEHAERTRQLLQRKSTWERDKVAVAKSRREVDAAVTRLEEQRRLSSVFCHVDQDQYYAACEEQERPELSGKAFAVGGIGMISTANYVARKYGVRSAMPGFIALKLCPHLIFVRPDFSKYTAKAQEVRGVLRTFDANLQVRGLDEASLDVTAYVKGRRDRDVLEAVAEKIRHDVAAATGGLTCSVGIAPTRELAKIASDRNKPNGQCIVEDFTREAVLSFIRPLETRKITGIGKVTDASLKALGITTVEDLYNARYLLHGILTPTASSFLLRTSLGIGAEDVSADRGGAEDDQQEHNRKSCSVGKSTSIQPWRIHNLRSVTNLPHRKIQQSAHSSQSATVTRSQGS